MSNRRQLTSEEQEQLRELTKGMKDGAGRAVSFDEMLNRWQSLVRRIERGYDDSIYDYTNALSVRDRLAGLVDDAPASLGGKLKDSMDGIDARFSGATEDAARPLTDVPIGDRWWWSRVPVLRVGELGEDLDNLGYLA
jgi:hypothetical protein